MQAFSNNGGLITGIHGRILQCRRHWPIPFGIAVALRVVVAVVVYLVIIPYYVWMNSADVTAYHSQGILIAEEIRSGAFEKLDVGFGSSAISFFFGCVYACFGPHFAIVSLLYLIISIGGAWCWTRAIQIRSNLRKGSAACEAYVMLSPGIALWTLLPGKDGIIVFGIAYMLMAMSEWTLRPGTSVGRVVIGLAIVFIVRPHVGIVLMGSALLAAVLWKQSRVANAQSTRVFGVLAAIVMFAGALPLARQYANLKELSAEAVGNRIAEFGTANAMGGSLLATTSTPTVSEVVQNLPKGLMMILFRPYFWEAVTPLQVLVSLENLCLLGLFVSTLRVFARNLARIHIDFVLIYSLFAAMGLLVILSPLANAGLIVRQKIQVLPFLMILMTRGPSLVNRLARSRRRFVSELQSCERF